MAIGGYPIYDLFLYFIFYSFLGWAMETCYCSLCEHRLVPRGFLYGPICPIYGAGVLLMILFFTPLKRNLVLFYAANDLQPALHGSAGGHHGRRPAGPGGAAAQKADKEIGLFPFKKQGFRTSRKPCFFFRRPFIIPPSRILPDFSAYPHPGPSQHSHNSRIIAAG